MTNDAKSTALVGAESNEAILTRLGYTADDIAQLTEEEQALIIQTVAADLENMSAASTLRPSRFAIEHKHRKFIDDQGNAMDTIRGVVVFYHGPRGRWLEGEKHPTCSSQDGKIGTNADGLQIDCATCPFNPSFTKNFGDRDNCKEMRRLAIVQDDEHAPITVTLPPTSLKNWDEFASGMLRRGKPLIANEVELSLESAEAKGQSFARVKGRLLGPIPPKRLLQLSKFQSQMAEHITSMAVEGDDYPMQSDGGTEAAATADRAFD